MVVSPVTQTAVRHNRSFVGSDFMQNEPQASLFAPISRLIVNAPVVRVNNNDGDIRQYGSRG